MGQAIGRPSRAEARPLRDDPRLPQGHGLALVTEETSVGTIAKEQKASS
jgi:hypothetical protein